jgi:4-hydroxymandelate oxidase
MALVTLDDYEIAARELISPTTWEYIHSGAGDEHTLRWNREAFGRVRLSPRVLNDVHVLDTRVRVLGHDLAHPILLAPVAANGLVHPDGEVAAARGARAAEAGMILSSYTSKRVEEVAAAAPRPFWFQLYIQERSATRDLIGKVVAAGCSALFLTVDTPSSGSRDRQARSGFTFPDLPYRTVEPGDNPCTWKDIEWIRREAGVPLVLKGILHPDDAERAIDEGAAGVVVSNHGARNLDTLPATLDALPSVSDRVRGRLRARRERRAPRPSLRVRARSGRRGWRARRDRRAPPRAGARDGARGESGDPRDRSIGDLVVAIGGRNTGRS